MNCHRCGALLLDETGPCMNCAEIAKERVATKQGLMPKPGQVYRNRGVYCGRCGARVFRGMKQCSTCGIPLAPPVPAHPQDNLPYPPYLKEVITRAADTHHCDKCGLVLAPGWVLCPKCGREFGRPVPPNAVSVKYVDTRKEPKATPNAPLHVIVDGYVETPLTPSQKKFDVWFMWSLAIFCVALFAWLIIIRVSH